LAWIDHFVANPLTQSFIDVGANIGVFSLYAMSQKSDLRVLAVEPASNTLEVLEANIAANGWGPRAITDSSPLSSKTESGYWVSASDRVADSGHQFQFETSTNSKSKVVLARSGDDLLSEHSLKPKFILKIDVDGHELEILRGFENLFRSGEVLSTLVELELDALSEAEALMTSYGFSHDNKFEDLANHSRFRRQEKGSNVVNKVFSRRSET